MPRRNERRLILGLGVLLFLLSCIYVPWEHRYYQSVLVHPANAAEPYLEYHLATPTETRYGWVFRHPVAARSTFGSGLGISTEVNLRILIVEWLGICLFTGGLMLFFEGGWPVSAV